MTGFSIRRGLALLLAAVLFFCSLGTALAEDSTPEEGTLPEDAVTETTEPPTEFPTEPAETIAEPTEAVTEPSEDATEPSETVAEPTGTMTEPAEAPTEPTDTTEPASSPVLPINEEPEAEGPRLYFGQLHAHSDPGSGADTIRELFSRAARTENMQFFAVTDHSDSFDHADAGSILDGSASQYWAAGKTIAREASSGNFLALYGFEMSWPERMKLGHITTLNTPGFQSWIQEAYVQQANALTAYYDAMSSGTGAIGQWNHPGNQCGTFSDFEPYSTAVDGVMQLLEVGTGSRIYSGYRDGSWYYNRALDKGWHVAPSNNAESARTVVLAETLTEESLYNAIKNHRVYATEDKDLEVRYTLDGFCMGSILKTWQTGQTADLFVELHDPTDSAIGQVEVIVDGGTVAARQSVSGNRGAVSFSLSSQYHYYYLRITQPDGDVAVTAPVWIDSTEHLGISGLTCETDIPVQGENTTLKLHVFNGETGDFLVESLKILADDVLLTEEETLPRIAAGSELTHTLTIACDIIGQTEITVILSGTLNGAPREFETSRTLSFRQSRQVSDIVVDAAHGNAGVSDLGVFRAMAAKENIRITVADTGLTEELLKTCRFLLITVPTEPFSQNFLNLVSEYVRYGGSVLVCGRAAVQDGALSGAEELNRLLEAVGSTMRLNRDILTNTVYNGGEMTLLFPEEICTSLPWSSGVVSGQRYRHNQGCSVSAGQGSVLVTGRPTTVSDAGHLPVMLCCEETGAGGTILAAGSLLLGNEELREPASLWDLPYANRTIARNLLGIGGEALALSSIRQAREAEEGTVLRIRGYVTAGTANVWNRFPRTLYVQDDTGGVGVIPFDAEGIAVGTPVEIIGSAENRDGNRILKTVSHKVLDTAFYRYLPKTGDWKTLLDAELHGGELVEVEGTCTDVILAENGAVSEILLKDSAGNTARVLVESYIFSGATGKNELQDTIRKERTVRAVGILHVDENGDVVIRVRNCEEVVYVPPRKLYINPKTGDRLFGRRK